MSWSEEKVCNCILPVSAPLLFFALEQNFPLELLELPWAPSERAFQMSHRWQTVLHMFSNSYKKIYFFWQNLRWGCIRTGGRLQCIFNLRTFKDSSILRETSSSQSDISKLSLLIYLDDLCIYYDWLFVWIIIPKIQKCARVSYYASDQLYSSKETSKVGKWSCIHSGRVWAANVAVWHGSVGTNINLYM